MVRQNQKPANVFATCAVILIAGIFCIISSIIGLSSDAKNMEDAFSIGLEKSEFYEGEIKYCSSCVCEYSHKVNFIPAGTEYYFLAISIEQSKAIVICADKNFADNFDEDTGKALSTVYSKGKVKKLPDTTLSHFADIKKKLNFIETNNSFDTLYLDLLCNRIYTFRLIAGIGFLISGLIWTMIFLNQESKSKYIEYIFSKYAKLNKFSALIGAAILIVSLLLTCYTFILHH